MVAWIRAVVGGENSAYYILIEFQAKRQIDLLGYARTTVSWIAWYGIPAFHLDNGIEGLPRCIGYDLPGWSFGSRFAASTW